MNSESACNRRVTLLRLGLMTAVGLGVIASASGLIVNETEFALVLRFGKPSRALQDAGLYFRLPPPIEQVVRVDRRLQHADIRLSETLTRDQRNVVVPMFFTWRVSDPLMFHTSVRDKENARLKLDAFVTSARNSVLGRHDFAGLLAHSGAADSLADIEAEIHNLAKNDAASQLGIDLVSTGIAQIQLPEANTESVFRRMRAERKREATQYRAEGRAKSAEMKAQTDKEATHLIADAKRQAEELRGKAEAEAAAIYAAAHGQDPQFYRFLRELQSLRTVVDKNTTLILDTGMAPFHWLKGEAELPTPPASITAPGNVEPPVHSAPPALLDPTP